MVTLQDIAKMAGVSKSTVSRYLNNGSVGKNTRKKIDAIIKETGYQPNPFAQSLKAGKSNMIGVIIPRYDSSSTNEVLKGIDAAATERGINLIIMSANLNRERTLRNILTLQTQKVDSIILLGSFMNEELKRVIRESTVPIILIGQSISGAQALVYDDYRAGKLIAQHAIALGHQKLAFIGVTEEDYAVGVLRKKGFYDYAEENGAEITYIETDFSRTNARDKALNFLPQLDATYIAAATDHIAIGIHGAAQELGYSIPNDFSLSGFGGYKAAEYLTPTITTVNFPYYEMGEVAVQVATDDEHLNIDKNEPMILSVVMNQTDSTKLKENE
ncbi:LacI family DNA-binding transcriptional regulator [Aerococcaceae bacterium DSM 111176]|nr:LacI family DNA-binding transcriptional regulator [Aerococcaceae bacterium DSM 111176]